jgi:hypothetical protein
MSKEFDSRNGLGKPKVYQIRIKGHLDHEWMDWFGALNISLEDNGETILTFEVVDQAALHGLLKKVRDSGMTLISVNPARLGQSDMPEV